MMLHNFLGTSAQILHQLQLFFGIFCIHLYSTFLLLIYHCVSRFEVIYILNCTVLYHLCCNSKFFLWINKYSILFYSTHIYFFLSSVNGKIIWVDKISDKGPILIEGDDLKVLESGYYFLTLQVTLKTPVCPCNGTVDKKCMVKISQQNREILEGWVNKNSCSTGLLAKVEKLSAGTKLNVTIKMPDNEIDERESVTHLGIIMLKL